MSRPKRTQELSRLSATARAYIFQVDTADPIQGIYKVVIVASTSEDAEKEILRRHRVHKGIVLLDNAQVHFAL